MRKEPKEHLDRDSLLLFRTLCATHNLQRAASQLGMPQATASRSLTKLREAFEDELFTRCSGGLTPTPKALALEPKVAAVIASFEDLFVEETFDPASLVREFRIACADHAMFYIEPAVTLASRMAPGVTFRLSPNGDDWLVELQRGDLDFAIFPIERAPEGCACLPLSSCRSVLVVRSDHPLARRFDEAGALTLEECLAHRYVEVRTGPEWVFKAMDASVSEAWIARPRAVRTPYFFSAAQMVKRSDLCFTCSETLAHEVAGTDEFRILPGRRRSVGPAGRACLHAVEKSACVRSMPGAVRREDGARHFSVVSPGGLVRRLPSRRFRRRSGRRRSSRERRCRRRGSCRGCRP